MVGDHLVDFGFDYEKLAVGAVLGNLVIFVDSAANTFGF